MKYRHSFVANSSSSSFTIDIKRISPLQLYAIINYKDVAKVIYPDMYVDGGWKIKIDKDKLSIDGDTNIDNFDFERYLEKVGVEPAKSFTFYVYNKSDDVKTFLDLTIDICNANDGTIDGAYNDLPKWLYEKDNIRLDTIKDILSRYKIYPGEDVFTIMDSQNIIAFFFTQYITEDVLETNCFSVQEIDEFSDTTKIFFHIL